MLEGIIVTTAIISAALYWRLCKWYDRRAQERNLGKRINYIMKLKGDK